MERFFRYSLTTLLCSVAVMECVQIFLRYVFEMPLMWLDESIIFPAIWMYCLGCANASRDNTQIVAKILPVFFSGEYAKAIIDCIAFAFSSVISCWLTWYAGDYFLYAVEINRETGYLFLPLVWAEAAIFAGMLLITFYTVVHFFKSLKLVSVLRAASQGGRAC